MEKLPLSLVVITFNEEKNIERCLLSVPFAADIVVLDSGSTDRTVEVARTLGARVRIEPWRGYHKQKTRAVALALNPWVLSLDADEALSPEAAKEVKDLFANGWPEIDGFYFPRMTYHLGKWIKYGGWYPDRQLRLFHREKCRWTEDEVHEKVVGFKINHLNGPILHWSFEDLADQVTTINNYSSLRAKSLVSQYQKVTFGHLILVPLRKFVEKYWFKSGFRDGRAGFIIAVVSAFSVFLRMAKLWEMKKTAVEDPQFPQ